MSKRKEKLTNEDVESVMFYVNKIVTDVIKHLKKIAVKHDTSFAMCCLHESLVRLTLNASDQIADESKRQGMIDFIHKIATQRLKEEVANESKRS